MDLFFVISGYLITTITLSDIAKGRFSFIQFFIKRIKRIVPAYLMLLLAVSVAGVYIYLHTDILYLRGTILRSALFISNHLFASGDSYFGAKLSENPLLHTWSLAIEMQFYVILPFILWFFRDRLRIVLPVIIIATTLYSSYNLYYLDNKSAMYFSLTARVPEFLMGAWFAVLFKQGLEFRRTSNNLIAGISLAVLVGCAFFITEESSFPGYLALIPCSASAMLLVIKNNFVSDFFSRKLPVFIGEMSYSLYLWHWPILAFMRYRNDGYQLSWPEVIAAVFLTFLLSWLSYFFVEKTLRKQSNKRTFISLAAGLAVLIGLYVYIPIASDNKKLPDIYTKPVIGIRSHNDGIIEKFGDMSKNDSIVLIGDSHALMLKPFLNKIGMKQGFSFYTLTTNLYPPLSGINKSEIKSKNYKFFDNSIKLIPKADSLIKSNKIIILNYLPQNNPPSLNTAIQNLAAGLSRDQKLILLGSFPTLSKNPLKLNNNITKKKELKISKTINSANNQNLMKIASKYSNVYYYDISQSNIFKQAPFINDTIGYYDQTHINHFGSEKLAEDIGDHFFKFLKNLQ